MRKGAPSRLPRRTLPCLRSECRLLKAVLHVRHNRGPLRSAGCTARYRLLQGPPRERAAERLRLQPLLRVGQPGLPCGPGEVGRRVLVTVPSSPRILPHPPLSGCHLADVSSQLLRPLLLPGAGVARATAYAAARSDVPPGWPGHRRRVRSDFGRRRRGYRLWLRRERRCNDGWRVVVSQPCIWGACLLRLLRPWVCHRERRCRRHGCHWPCRRRQRRAPVRRRPLSQRLDRPRLQLHVPRQCNAVAGGDTDAHGLAGPLEHGDGDDHALSGADADGDEQWDGHGQSGPDHE